MINNTFETTLLHWYAANRRILPWRDITDPYRIWLSEIILQQTQVTQGLHYYLTFCEHYPTVADLAAAPLDDILKLWQGLGYYSRARNLHAAAQQIMQQFGGCFPNTYKGILSLRGVGAYTAAAIASFAFALPHAVVDGNVYRFCARYFGITTPIDTTAGQKLFAKLAQDLLDMTNPARHNQAMMEFGALQCTPTPHCDICPLANSCTALSENIVAQLPVKSHKINIRTRYFTYLCMVWNRHIYLHQRNGRDIWKSLYELPLIETETSCNAADAVAIACQKGWINGTPHIVAISPTRIHKLTHQTIKAHCVLLRLQTPPTEPSFIATDTPDDYAVPRLVEHFIDWAMQHLP